MWIYLICLGDIRQAQQGHDLIYHENKQRILEGKLDGILY